MISVDSRTHKQRKSWFIRDFCFSAFTWLIILGGIVTSCNEAPQVVSSYSQISGSAQGTTFSIWYNDTANLDVVDDVDSILKAIDQSMSSYVRESQISRFNRNDSNFTVDVYLEEVFHQSVEVYRQTNGYFDPTVKPLVRFWGFDELRLKRAEEEDSSKVDSIRNYVGLHKLLIGAYPQLEDGVRSDDPVVILYKENPEIKLDLNAIAQGYTVDVLGLFLERLGVEDYMVEVGGEVRARGVNRFGESWKIGIDRPELTTGKERKLQTSALLVNRSMATSGSYRKFYEKDGVRYSHTINPKTGYPVSHNLLSVTVLADDCAQADAYATAFMAMGLEKTKSFIEEGSKGLDVFLIYDENGKFSTYASPGFKKVLKEI